MTTKDINNQIISHIKKLEVSERKVKRIYERAVNQLAALAANLGLTNLEKPFTFSQYPQIKKAAEKIMNSIHSNLQATITDGSKLAWELSNEKNDTIVKSILGFTAAELTKAQQKQYFSNNDKALEAFTQRKEKGLNLSDRVWSYTRQFKAEIEMGLDLGIREGKSAAAMARDLKQYLREPNKLFRRVRDVHGQLHLSRAAKAYNPGAGVYRSSYKNALRLARTENNMAYRTADHTRWQQNTSIVGIEVRLSNNHTLNGVPFTDICDDLARRYPKDFKFTGWHPACRCHVVPILKTEDERLADYEKIMNGETPSSESKNAVEDVPKNFKAWLTDNKDRIAISGYKGTTPYFLLDNDKYVHLANFKATKLQKFTVDSRNEYLNYDVKKWKRDYFNGSNGGYLIIDKQRIEQSKINAQEHNKYAKERDMSLILAQNGNKIEFPKEAEGNDILINGLPADLKKTKSHNHIIDYASHAIKNQGAELVVFEFEAMNHNIVKKLYQLSKRGYKDKVLYFTSASKVLRTL